MPIVSLSDDQAVQQAAHEVHSIRIPEAAPIKQAGRVASLGESSNLAALVYDIHGTEDGIHYPLPDTVRGSRARLTDLGNIEMDILPPRALCDEIVESYLRWVAPVVPLINRSQFMRLYRDNENPPSLLLLQAILLAGSRVCTNPQLIDTNGSTASTALKFYQRAKALYNADYEDDRVTIVQSLVLMGWSREGPEGKLDTDYDPSRSSCSDTAPDFMENGFYWTRIATTVAQGSGMHRRSELCVLCRHLAYILQRRTVTARLSRQALVETSLVDTVHARPIGSGVPGPPTPHQCR